MGPLGALYDRMRGGSLLVGAGHMEFAQSIVGGGGIVGVDKVVAVARIGHTPLVLAVGGSSAVGRHCYMMAGRCYNHCYKMVLVVGGRMVVVHHHMLVVQVQDPY